MVFLGYLFSVLLLRHESYQTFSIAAKTFFVPVAVLLDESTTMGNWLVIQPRNFVPSSVEEFFCCKFTPTLVHRSVKKQSQLLMLRIKTLFVDCQFRSNRKVSDGKTGNMLNLSSIKQSFLVSIPIIEQRQKF